MNISKNSWHYKFLSRHKKEIPKSLCPYFWSLVFNLSFWVMVGLGIFGLLLGFLHFFLEFYYYYQHTFNLSLDVILGFIWGVIKFTLVICVMSLAFVAICFALAIMIGIVIMPFSLASPWFKKTCFRLLDKLPSKPNNMNPNLLFEFLKAKKDKVCPILNFVDDKKKGT